MYNIVRLTPSHETGCLRHLREKQRWLLAFVGILVAILSLITAAPSQTIEGTYSLRPEEDIKNTLDFLRKDKGVEALKSFFPETYDKELASLLVFIDRANDAPARISLIKGNKTQKNLWGEKYVYVMVFVAEKTDQTPSVSRKVVEEEISTKIVKKVESGEPLKKSCESTTVIKEREPLLVHQSSLNYEPGTGEFFVSAIVRLTATIFSGKTLEKAEEAKKGADIPDKPVRLRKAGSHGRTNLYFTYEKLSIYENTINRITVEEDYGQGEVYRHLATFGNYSASRITTSIGVVGTFTNHELVEPSRFPVDCFAFGHYYMKRPKLPPPHDQKGWISKCWNRMSFSLVAGTNLALDKDLFKDFFVGVSIGHVVSTIALVAGVNFRTPRDAEGKLTKRSREPSICVGFSFIF